MAPWAAGRQDVVKGVDQSPVTAPDYGTITGGCKLASANRFLCAVPSPFARTPGTEPVCHNNRSQGVPFITGH